MTKLKENMTPQRYISVYGLNTQNPDVDGFINHLGSEFKNRLEAYLEEDNSHGRDFTYKKFNQLVNETRCKFNSCSNKRAGVAYPDSLFGKCFAKYIAPLREAYFPEEHAKALAYKAKKALEPTPS